MNLTVANSLQNVIAFGDCNTGTKLFICSTEIKSCCFQASCSSCPFSLSSCLLFWAQIHPRGTTNPFSPFCLQIQPVYPQSVTGH